MGDNYVVYIVCYNIGISMGYPLLAEKCHRIFNFASPTVINTSRCGLAHHGVAFK